MNVLPLARLIVVAGLGVALGCAPESGRDLRRPIACGLTALPPSVRSLQVTRVVLSRLSSDSKMEPSATLPSFLAIECSTCKGNWVSQKCWTSEACEELISSNLPIIPPEVVADVAR